MTPCLLRIYRLKQEQKQKTSDFKLEYQQRSAQNHPNFSINLRFNPVYSAAIKQLFKSNHSNTVMCIWYCGHFRDSVDKNVFPFISSKISSMKSMLVFFFTFDKKLLYENSGQLE